MATRSNARVAVIGAGVAGLACARELKAGGADVAVFEANATAGGRAATLITEYGPYDHGAQYFTVHGDRFAAAVRNWEAEGVVQRWGGRIVILQDGTVEDRTSAIERFVPVPGMLRLGRQMAQGLPISFNTTVVRLERTDAGWKLHAQGEGSGAAATFDAVCVALPSPLTAGLLRDLTPIAETAATVNWDPCWAAVVALQRSTGADFDGAFFNDDPILGWGARDSAKPRRGAVSDIAERWVLHARPRWSRRFYQMDEDEVAKWLVRSFAARIRRTLNPRHVAGFRWPCATPLNPLSQTCLWDAEQRLGAAGDWCGGPRIEGAFLSGLALARAVLAPD